MTLDEMPPTAAIQPVEPGYRHVLRLSAALFWLPLFIGSLVVNYLALRDTPVFGLPPLIVGLVAFSAISFAPDRIYRRLGYSVDAGLLRVVVATRPGAGQALPVAGPGDAVLRHQEVEDGGDQVAADTAHGHTAWKVRGCAVGSVEPRHPDDDRLGGGLEQR
ncbi:MAG: hypothetical protein ABI617_03730, partial [Sphingomicrobium sp.]